MRLSQASDRLVTTNNEGFCLFDTGTGERSMFLAAPQGEDDRTSPRYEAATKVPTVFILYEDFFDDRFNATISFLTSNGYAVMQPSVDLERGFPGEAWLKGVTAAATKLVELGLADPKRLGVHGTSYGGYATNLLVTQPDRLAAAINISGKTDMISFYTDSPRLGTRNIHAPERSQDRLGVGTDRRR